jgi:hypothetical protein
MSDYRTHIIAYAVFALCLRYVLTGSGLDFGSGWDASVPLLVGAAYSILPDIDARTSNARAIASLALVAVSVAAFSTGHAVTAAGALIALGLVWMSRHRRTIHTPLAGLIFSLPLLAVDWRWFAMGLAGYLTHLALDGRLIT